jgi:hypothetical protein
MNYTVVNKYYSGNKIRAGHVASVEEKRKAYRNLVENSRGNKSLGVDGNILKYILKKEDRKARIGFIWLRIGRSDETL